MSAPTYEERVHADLTVNEVVWQSHGTQHYIRLYSHGDGTTGLRVGCGGLEADVFLPADAVELLTAAIVRANALAHAEEVAS